jgi:hypothetical protein
VKFAALKKGGGQKERSALRVRFAMMQRKNDIVRAKTRKKGIEKNDHQHSNSIDKCESDDDGQRQHKPRTTAATAVTAVLMRQ